MRNSAANVAHSSQAVGNEGWSKVASWDFGAMLPCNLLRSDDLGIVNNLSIHQGRQIPFGAAQVAVRSCESTARSASLSGSRLPLSFSANSV